MREFLDSDRFDFPLTADSVVCDVGAYHGIWSKHIAERYGCTILAYEPVLRFFQIASANLVGLPKVALLNCGLGGSFRMQDFHIQADSTGMFSTAPEVERVTIMPLVPHLRSTAFPFFDLLKINAEGCEYEILEHIIASQANRMFGRILVQFHTCAPDWERRYAQIAASLSFSHDCTARKPFVWEKWEIRA
jgi:FkbM family methyltransferase